MGSLAERYDLAVDGNPHLDPMGKWVALRGKAASAPVWPWKVIFASTPDDASIPRLQLVSLEHRSSFTLPGECDGLLLSPDGQSVAKCDSKGGIEDRKSVV